MSLRISLAGAPPRKIEQKQIAPPEPAPERAVSFVSNNIKLYGVARGPAKDGKLTVRLAVPDTDGKRLFAGVETVEADAVTVQEASLPFEDCRVESRNRQQAFDGETKGVAIKDGDGRTIDYKSVKIVGYASTFLHVTESDRQGDAVKPGTFRETIKRFMDNPVMLLNHHASVENIAGHWSIVREDDRGLYVEGLISDAPSLATVRFHLMEKNLRTLSIGGIWMYEPDGRTISKAHLFEISLVAIPANPDAIIQARSLDLESACKCARYLS